MTSPGILTRTTAGGPDQRMTCVTHTPAMLGSGFRWSLRATLGAVETIR